MLKDDAGNTRSVPAEAVTVQADTVLPLVKLLLPKKGVADEVGSWKKVFGQATDDKGTGVDSVAVVAIEKRATGWYFFKATSKTWAKAATKGKAWKRAKAAVVDPSAKGAWVVRLTGSPQGHALRPRHGHRRGRQRLEAGHPQGGAHRFLISAGRPSDVAGVGRPGSRR